MGPKFSAKTPSSYAPQVDEPASYIEGPPPAYPKGNSTKVQLLRLAAHTVVVLIILIGAFVLLAAYIKSISIPCECSNREFERRLDPEPLIAEPSHDVTLHIGEDIRKATGKRQLNCLVERNEQILDAMPDQGPGKLQVKGETTIISCSTGKPGKRIPRSSPCACNCAC